MKVTDLLDVVKETLTQRGKDNGYDKGEERSAAGIAEIYRTLTGRNMNTADAWTALISLKFQRLRTQLAQGCDPYDTIVDLVAYAALLGEEVTEKWDDENTIPAKKAPVKEKGTPRTLNDPKYIED